MIDSDTALILESPESLAVLRAYRQAQDSLDAEPHSVAANDRSATPDAHHAEEAVADSSGEATTAADGEHEADTDTEAESDGPARQRRGSRWVQRITSLNGVDRETLSRIHGRLIAFGFLKCELGERATGMLYQVSHSGKHVLTLALEAESRAAA